MGNMFRCTLKSGGASGTGIPLLVTCSEDFAGKTITATDGTTTLTETCPSTSPYTLQFDLPNTGSWTISGVIEGVTYSETIAVTEYQLDLFNGFNYKAWVSRGGLDPDDYASLSAVFADEAAVRRLMLIHASADYLIDCVTDNIDDIDVFCANDTAMKWLGLCDYVCDGLTAITGVEAKLLASTYWERYLKDHVPTMTSNTAPYGAASAGSAQSGYEAYKAFDEDESTRWLPNTGGTSSVWWVQYEFTNPINVRAVAYTQPSDSLSILGFEILGSNDGTNFTSIFSQSVDTPSPTEKYLFSNENYYLYYRFRVTSTPSTRPNINTLQFYGRALNVSVPTMTSNTAPYGIVSASSERSSYDPYKAFDGDASTMWGDNSEAIGEVAYIQYRFTNPICVKQVFLNPNQTTITERADYVQILGSNNGVDWSNALNIDQATMSEPVMRELNNDNTYLFYRVAMKKKTSGYVYFKDIQFYGLDYSEKEFEAGTSRKWLYDHGVELQVFTGYTSSANATAEKQADNLYLAKTNANSTNASFTAEQNDFTDYDLTFVITGDISFPQSLSSGSKSILITTGELPTAAGTTLAAIGLFNKLNYLDISSVDQTAYLRLLVLNGSSGGTAMGMDIEEVWVE